MSPRALLLENHRKQHSLILPKILGNWTMKMILKKMITKKMTMMTT